MAWLIIYVNDSEVELSQKPSPRKQRTRPEVVTSAQCMKWACPFDWVSLANRKNPFVLIKIIKNSNVTVRVLINRNWLNCWVDECLCGWSFKNWSNTQLMFGSTEKEGMWKQRSNYGKLWKSKTCSNSISQIETENFTRRGYFYVSRKFILYVTAKLKPSVKVIIRLMFQ